MTLNSSSTRQLDINKIVQRSLQLSGLIAAGQGQSGTTWDQWSPMARDFLENIVDYLQSEGIYARSVDFFEVEAIEKQEIYDLPPETLDIVDAAMFKPRDEEGNLDPNETETVVTQAIRNTYQQLSNKRSEGRPSIYYVERGPVLKVYLWPVPDSDGVITFQRHRLLADNDDGTKTLDLQRYWTRYITYELAHDLAVAGTIDTRRCSYLGQQSERLLRAAKRYAKQRTTQQGHMTHRTGWIFS